MVPKPHSEDSGEVNREKNRVGEAEWEWVGFVKLRRKEAETHSKT